MRIYEGRFNGVLNETEIAKELADVIKSALLKENEVVVFIEIPEESRIEREEVYEIEKLKEFVRF